METPKVSYDYDYEAYMHGYCQYFAFEAQKIYGGKICLWLDFDEISEREVLCHAFLEITPGLYLDAYGAFRGIKDREDEFEYNYQNIITCTPEESEQVLKGIKLKYTDVTLKRNVREYLRNNRLLMKIRMVDGLVYPFVIRTRDSIRGVDKFITNIYDEKQKRGYPLCHNIRVTKALNLLIETPKMVEDINWYYKN